MTEFLRNLGVSPFEVIVGVIVLAIVTVVWIINRTRREDKPKIKIQTEILAVVITIIALITIVVVRSGIIAENPLLFFVSVVLLLTAIASFSDVFFSVQVRQDLRAISARFGAQMAGLGNLQFFPTKEETFKHLTALTYHATEKLIATRFSAADISTESEYWVSIKQRALDPRILYIRIHCLAHTSSMTIDGVCKLISEFKGAQQFRLGIAFFNNSFEMIIADEKECIFCFHDLEMTVRNGFRVDTTLPSSSKVVANFDSTLRRMLERCYLVIDFGKFVRTDDDVQNLQNHLRKVHQEYCQGKLPELIHSNEVERFLKSKIFKLEH